MHSITSLSRLTGVKQETIRTWERRYNAVKPIRDDRGRRVYTEEDMHRIRLLGELVRAGHVIGDLVNMTNETLEQMRADHNPVRASRADELLEHLVGAIAAYDLSRFEMLIGSALTNLPPLSATEHVIAPVMVEIGERWRSGGIDIAQEHELSAIVRRQLTIASAYLSSSADGASIVFSTLSDEDHEIGALMAAYIAASERCVCHYLGPNTPAVELAKAVDRSDAAILALSLVHAPDRTRIEAQLSLLAERVRPSTEIIIGVGQVAIGREFSAPARIVLVDSLTPFARRVASLAR